MRSPSGAYLKARDNLVMRDGLLYHKLKLSTTGETVWRFRGTKGAQGCRLGWMSSRGRPSRPKMFLLSDAGAVLVAWHGS